MCPFLLTRIENIRSISGRLVINVPQAFLSLYLQESLNLPCSTVATIPLTYFIAGLFIATLLKQFSKYLGNQLTFAIGIALNVCGAWLIYSDIFASHNGEHEWGLYLIFSLLGGGASVGMVMGLSITADLIGNNVESGAFVYGCMSFCDKMSNGLAIMGINFFAP